MINDIEKNDQLPSALTCIVLVVIILTRESHRLVEDDGGGYELHLGSYKEENLKAGKPVKLGGTTRYSSHVDMRAFFI